MRQGCHTSLRLASASFEQWCVAVEQATGKSLEALVAMRIIGDIFAYTAKEMLRFNSRRSLDGAELAKRNPGSSPKLWILAFGLHPGYPPSKVGITHVFL